MNQRAVMLCGWGIKAGVACLQVKLCVAISERFRKYVWYLKALYKCPGFYFFYHSCHLPEPDVGQRFTNHQMLYRTHPNPRPCVSIMDGYVSKPYDVTSAECVLHHRC